MVRYARWGLLALLFGAQVAWSQPEVPVEQWQGKTILLIGAHPDDDSYAHGTLARLAAQGNDVYVLLLTMGNVGTKDTTLSRTQLARIRKQEEINALAASGFRPITTLTWGTTMDGSNIMRPTIGKNSFDGLCTTSAN